MEVATWGNLSIICESCNNLEGGSKENCPLELDSLTTHNFQTDFHTCTNIFDKYIISAENFKIVMMLQETVFLFSHSGHLIYHSFSYSAITG